MSCSNTGNTQTAAPEQTLIIDRGQTGLQAFQ